MRLLGVVRLSDLTDETTSPERQLAKIETYARLHDHELVGVAEDLDVSGAVPPDKRPQLGPWLKRLDEWDGVAVARFDRLSRSLRDFANFCAWLDEHGKVLVCLDPQIDLSTPGGRSFAQMLAVFAEFERSMIAARVKDAYSAARKDGRYAGGQQTFGYRPVKRAKGWGFEPDPDYSPIVREMADRLLAHQSLNMIARWLNDSGVPTSRNVVRIRNGKPIKPGKWRGFTVGQILCSQAILGATVDQHGEPLRDDSAAVIYRADPLITREKFEQVRAILSKNAAGPRVNSSPLLRVIFCGECMEDGRGVSPLYVSVTRSAGKEYRYYHCRVAHSDATACQAKRIKADELEMMTEMALLGQCGDAELTESREIPAQDHTEEMARAAETIGHLSQLIALGSAKGQDVSADEARLTEAKRQLSHLAGLPVVPARTEALPTGELFKDRWTRLGQRERNQWLQTAQVKAVAMQDPLSVLLMSPGDIDVSARNLSASIADLGLRAVVSDPLGFRGPGRLPGLR
jgi:DNA invertase Pin-like site-specific DNA recombinase